MEFAGRVKSRVYRMSAPPDLCWLHSSYREFGGICTINSRFLDQQPRILFRPPSPVSVFDTVRGGEAHSELLARLKGPGPEKN